METRKYFEIFYKKNTGILLKNTSGNIKKEELKIKRLVKGNRQTTKKVKDPTTRL